MATNCCMLFIIITVNSYLAVTFAFGFNSKTFNYLQSQRACGTKLYTSPSTSFESFKWDLQLTSPCKLNLFLRIISRRPNGYHDLASLFQTISLADTLYMSKIDTEVQEDEIYVRYLFVVSLKFIYNTAFDLIVL